MVCIHDKSGDHYGGVMSVVAEDDELEMLAEFEKLLNAKGFVVDEWHSEGYGFDVAVCDEFEMNKVWNLYVHFVAGR